MSFDKNKAMRNAERFLSQGKIRAAINEYQRVVENDPKDFSTLNILGDLYAKSRDKQEAVGCFTQVAEHYNMQGFSHKAIAIYNKISRIEPNSIEVSAKLAELYQLKGSISEARLHYTTLAEHYQSKGQKIEALAIWKRIAELDPNNTDIYLKIAETCWQEEQFEQAAEAFIEAGLRMLRQEKFEAALAAFSKTLEIKKDDLRALKGLVKAQIGLGDTDEAAKTLEDVLREQPHNRDILYLLVDCYLDMNNPAEAERAIIKLVEQEPANYLKFLDLVKLYLKSGDLDAATRVLSMSSEHLLVGGQADDFLEWTNEILARNPEQIEALRLLVRFYGWQRNVSALKQSLERLAETARSSELAEDEHHALSQLVMISPQSVGYAERLLELNTLYGFETALPNGDSGVSETPQFENFAVSDEEESSGTSEKLDELNFADVQSSFEIESNGHSQNGFSNDAAEFEFYNEAIEATVVADDVQADALASFEATEQENGELKLADELQLQKQLESVGFYIEQGYLDLTLKTLDELEEQFGSRTEIAEFRQKLSWFSPPPIAVSEPEMVSQPELITEPEIVSEFEKEETAEQKPITEIASSAAKVFENLDELKKELDLEEDEASDDGGDYETHYHLATAYKEMGLMENAIREFQDAINLVEMNDGTHRFFQCANLLGHCFREKQMPKLAVTWFMRGLEVADLKDDEKHALYYELGDAFEAYNELENAVEYFGKLYAENVDYRNVSKRLQNLQENNSQI